MSEEILLRSDGPGYYIMSGTTEAGTAFVREHSSGARSPRDGISIGYSTYVQVIAEAKAAGLEVRIT